MICHSKNCLKAELKNENLHTSFGTGIKTDGLGTNTIISSIANVLDKLILCTGIRV